MDAHRARAMRRERRTQERVELACGFGGLLSIQASVLLAFSTSRLDSSWPRVPADIRSLGRLMPSSASGCAQSASGEPRRAQPTQVSYPVGLDSKTEIFFLGRTSGMLTRNVVPLPTP
jgi:hypothetical protein